jgi:hypothetical protein
MIGRTFLHADMDFLCAVYQINCLLLLDGVCSVTEDGVVPLEVLHPQAQTLPQWNQPAVIDGVVALDHGIAGFHPSNLGFLDNVLSPIWIKSLAVDHDRGSRVVGPSDCSLGTIGFLASRAGVTLLENFSCLQLCAFTCQYPHARPFARLKVL